MNTNTTPDNPRAFLTFILASLSTEDGSLTFFGGRVKLREGLWSQTPWVPWTCFLILCKPQYLLCEMGLVTVPTLSGCWGRYVWSNEDYV